MFVWILGSGASDGIPVLGCTCSHCQLARRVKFLRRRTTAMIISDFDSTIVLDVGFDISEYIEDLKIDGILISHWHYDHTSGLFRLRYSARSLSVFAPYRGFFLRIEEGPSKS